MQLPTKSLAPYSRNRHLLSGFRTGRWPLASRFCYLQARLLANDVTKRRLRQRPTVCFAWIGKIRVLASVLTASANTDIADLVGALIAMPRHDILMARSPAFFPFAAVLPDGPPLFKGQKPRDAASARVFLLSDKSMFLRVLSTQRGSGLTRNLSPLLRMLPAPRSGVGAVIGALSFAAICHRGA